MISHLNVVDLAINFLFVHCRVSISPDPTDKPNKKFNISVDSKTIQEEDEPIQAAPQPAPQPTNTEVAAPAERTRLIVFGIMKIQKTRLLATLSGLKVMSVYLISPRILIGNYFILSLMQRYLHCNAVLLGVKSLVQSLSNVPTQEKLVGL